MNLAQTLEALDRAIRTNKARAVFAFNAERMDDFADESKLVAQLQSLRDTLPQLVADAEAYRKMIAAGPCDGWLHVCGSASEVSRRQLYAEEIAHGWTQKPLYALPETKESGT